MTEVRLVFVTAPDSNTAAELTKTLIEENLVACGNIVNGIRSIYRWEGKVCDDTEVLVLLKTLERAVPRLKERLVELHPYECPELLTVSVADGLPDYLSWVREQVST